MKKLSEDKVRKIGEAYEKLCNLAQKQLREYQAYLKVAIAAALCTSAVRQNDDAVLLLIDEIKLSYVTREEAIVEGGLPTVSVVYEYPDTLYAFLTEDERCPRDISLRSSGVLLDAQKGPRAS
jgi:hypothetical protein